MENEKSSLGHMPAKDKWEFDESVVDCFDDMLERSIPSYARMRQLVFSVGCEFVKSNYEIVDLGASRGGAMRPFIGKYGAYNHFTLVEVSEPMLEVLREKYHWYSTANVIDVLNLDLRKEYPSVRACLTLSVLTLQFTPIEHRLSILGRVFEHTINDGAFVLVEKIIGSDDKLDGLFNRVYYDFKHMNGYSYDEIDRKKASLEGVLVPVSEQVNKDMLKSVGFKRVETFWRDTNFCGIVAVK